MHMNRRPQPMSFAEIAQQLGGGDRPARTTTSREIDDVFERARRIDERRNPQSTYSYEYDALAYGGTSR
jgi:hypothetical protein